MRISVRLIPLLTLLLPTVRAQESGLELIPETDDTGKEVAPGNPDEHGQEYPKR